MDINEFQNKLKDIQTLALNNGKQVRADLVEKFFGEEGMDQDKLPAAHRHPGVEIHVPDVRQDPLPGLLGEPFQLPERGSAAVSEPLAEGRQLGPVQRV